MRIMVLGLRGFPGIEGGVETHAEHLYPLLAELGCEVEVIVRSPYMPKRNEKMFRGVCFRRVWSPRGKGVEAFVHSLLGVLYAGIKRPDVLHIHAIGPAIVTPLARLLGLRVVVTHHGPDYDREKWGVFARWILRTGESLGMRFAHQRIVISKVIAELVRSRYHCDTELIPNGVLVLSRPKSKAALQKFGLDAGLYILQVSRLVPEKKQLDLIRAFTMADLPNWKLVLVGELDERDRYSGAVKALSERTRNVTLTGFLSGLHLREIYANAGGFVLPSSHEGLPIVLLEALSYGLPVLASDIPANLEVGLPSGCYFRVGDIETLANKLRKLAGAKTDGTEREKTIDWVKHNYDWATIANQTLAVYNTVVK